MKYATNVPTYTYQKFDSHHYQTFDRQTLSFTYHPIIPKPTVTLSQPDNQEVTNTEPAKGDVEQTTEENQPVNPEESSSSENNSESEFQVIILKANILMIL